MKTKKKAASAQPKRTPKVNVATICGQIRSLNSKAAQREVLEFVTELLKGE